MNVFGQLSRKPQYGYKVGDIVGIYEANNDVYYCGAICYFDITERGIEVVIDDLKGESYRSLISYVQRYRPFMDKGALSSHSKEKQLSLNF